MMSTKESMILIIIVIVKKIFLQKGITAGRAVKLCLQSQVTIYRKSKSENI